MNITELVANMDHYSLLLLNHKRITNIYRMVQQISEVELDVCRKNINSISKKIGEAQSSKAAEKLAGLLADEEGVIAYFNELIDVYKEAVKDQKQYIEEFRKLSERLLLENPTIN